MTVPPRAPIRKTLSDTSTARVAAANTSPMRTSARAFATRTRLRAGVTRNVDVMVPNRNSCVKARIPSTSRTTSPPETPTPTVREKVTVAESQCATDAVAGGHGHQNQQDHEAERRQQQPNHHPHAAQLDQLGVHQLRQGRTSPVSRRNTSSRPPVSTRRCRTI